MIDYQITQRREAVGLTQAQLAEAVARRAGKPFSQQSLQKLEAKLNKNQDASSRFLHHILEILEERELGRRGELMKIARTIDESKLGTAVRILEAIDRDEAS